MDIREYNITYIAKEFLSKKGWLIIAYNPPGSQGTFTIPNPQKDGTYKGQTGSLSPDIIAFRYVNSINELLIVEAKPQYNAADVNKMITMFNDPERRKIFLDIVNNVCLANEIPYNSNSQTLIRFAKAHSGDVHHIEGLNTLQINQIRDWDVKDINPKDSIYENFTVTASGDLFEN